jgi:hypothetical protein
MYKGCILRFPVWNRIPEDMYQQLLESEKLITGIVWQTSVASMQYDCRRDTN